MGLLGTGITEGERVEMIGIEKEIEGVGEEAAVDPEIGIVGETGTGGTETEIETGIEIEMTGKRKLRRKKDRVVGAGLALLDTRRVRRIRSQAKTTDQRREGMTVMLTERSLNLKRTRINRRQRLR